MVGASLFLIPYFAGNKINEKLAGFSSSDMYTRQDYNLQDHLWGDNFSESTRGTMLAASLFASTGYASPCQGLINRSRDLLLQFTGYQNLMQTNGISSRIVGCIIFSIPITIILTFALVKVWKKFQLRELLLYISLFSILLDSLPFHIITV